MDRVAEHGSELTARALHELAALPGVTVYGPRSASDRGAVVSFSVEGVHPHDVAAFLDAEGIAVRAGHHCAQPLMHCLGVVGTSRASFCVYTAPDDVTLLARTLAGIRAAL
jgi:cysteine desulfurase/selenocysteine lyase